MIILSLWSQFMIVKLLFCSRASDEEKKLCKFDTLTCPWKSDSSATTPVGQILKTFSCSDAESECFWGGPGKTTYTFSVMFRFPLPPPPGHLACYQQAGRVGQAETERKYVGVSWKHIRYFTPPLFRKKAFSAKSNIWGWIQVVTLQRWSQSHKGILD